MSDNRSILPGPDRVRAAGAEDYELHAFARRHGLTPDEVREMVERVGDDRDALEREAAKLRRS